MLTDKQIDESWKEILWLSNKGLCELRRDYARAIERQVSTRRNPLNPGVIDELANKYLKYQIETPINSGIFDLIRAVERIHGIGK